MVRETHSPNMEASANFKFPPQPLQQLSPERVNSTYLSTTTSTTSKTSKSGDATPDQSPFSSPTRKAQANLFADYDPNRNSPTKASSVMLSGGIQQSPSLPEITALRSHGRNNSDVQGLVKRFEHLDVRDRDAESQEKMKRREAELKRALCAREEAETDSKRLRAEVRRLEREAEEGRERERKVVSRVEVVTAELSAAKEAFRSQSSAYEKEIRRARKEAFKTSSAVVKLQEDLKATRSRLQVEQQGHEHERKAAEQKERERFEMEYQLIPLQEELEKLEQHFRVAREETMALKSSLKEEEVARIAAEGRIPLPVSQDLDDFDSPKKQSPVKRPHSPLSDDKENRHNASNKTGETRQLTRELEYEKIRRGRAEELAEFLQMECNFRCCRCKRTSTPGHETLQSLDAKLAAGLQSIRDGMKEVLASADRSDEAEAMDVDDDCRIQEEADEKVSEIIPIPKEQTQTSATEISAEDELDRSMTMTAESPRPAPPAPQLKQEQEAEAPPSTNIIAKPNSAEPVEATVSIPLQPSTPPSSSQPKNQTTPYHQNSIRTVTTTTTIPMHFTPVSKPHFPPSYPVDPVADAENIPPQGSDTGLTGLTGQSDSTVAPPAFDRAAALAAIEYRRGRAKSLANGTATPRKQMVEGVGLGPGGRRDISAPTLGQRSGNAGVGSGVKGVRMAMGSASVGRAGGRSGRMG